MTIYALNNQDNIQDIFSQLKNLDTVNFASGQYILNKSMIIEDLQAQNTVNINFGNASFIARNQLNNPLFWIKRSAKIYPSGGFFDGNALNQDLETNYVQGMQIDNSIDCKISRTTIFNVRRFGCLIQNDTSNCGIVDSVINNCMWNGINLGGDLGVEKGLYAINNDISQCADVGITSYGENNLIMSNKIYSPSNAILQDHAGAGAKWAIGNEKGSGTKILENTIRDHDSGIVALAAGRSDKLRIKSNRIYNSRENGIALSNSNDSQLTDNLIDSAYFGVNIFGDSNQNIIEPNNTFLNCYQNIVGTGYTIEQIPVIVPVPVTRRTLAARVPMVGNSDLVQVYLRKIRDKTINKKMHEKLHPLV